MIRIVTVLMGLTFGFGLVLASEGRMLHLRHFMASAEPDWASELSDATGLKDAFCGHSETAKSDQTQNILSVAGILYRLCGRD